MNVPVDDFFKQLLTNELLTAEDGFDGVFSGLKMLLFTNDVEPGRTTLYADLTQPTYTGYATQTFVPGAIYKDPSGAWAMHGASLQFQATADSTLEVIVGYALYLPGSPNKLRWCERFDNPVTLGLTTQAVGVMGAFRFGGEDYGHGTVVE